MKSKEEIEKKINELISFEDNFIELKINYVEGTSEYRFSEIATINTLREFAKWLCDNK